MKNEQIKSYEMDMCNGPILKKMLLFAIPLMCSSVLQLLFNAADIVVGGEMSGYNEMLIEARQIAIGRMVEEAEAMGANAIIGMKLMSSAVAAGAAEMVAYGTAVVIE